MRVTSCRQCPGEARGRFFPAVICMEEREKEMEREKGVDDDFCLSTNPTKRQLDASYATIDARMVVLKGSVDRWSCLGTA